MYYEADPPSTSTSNIQVSPTLPYHDFYYDGDYFYVDESSSYGIYFDESSYGELTIGEDGSYTLADFYSQQGTISVDSGYDYDCDHYWVCKDDCDVLRVRLLLPNNDSLCSC